MKSFTCVVGSTLFVSACVNPVPVTITELDTSDPQVWGGSLALDISDTGHIVGWYGSPPRVAAFEPKGQVVLLPVPPGYIGCQAVAVANDGRIAGTCTRNASEGANLPTAFFAESARSNLQFIPLRDNVEGTVLDMNNRGVILGRSVTLPDISSLRHWIYDTASGQLTDLPGLANAALAMTRASSINDAGDIAGDAPVMSGGTVYHQLVKWSAGTLAITAAPVRQGQILDVRAINNRGNIVGTTVDVSTNYSNASFWSSVTAAAEPLPSPAIAPPFVLQGTYAHAVNDDGWIIGYARVSQIGELAENSMGIAWTPDRRVIQLGLHTSAEAINASEVIVGSRAGNAVRFDLGDTRGDDVTPSPMAKRIIAK